MGAVDGNETLLKAIDAEISHPVLGTPGLEEFQISISNKIL